MFKRKIGKLTIEDIRDEQMHNLCEYNDRFESPGLPL